MYNIPQMYPYTVGNVSPDIPVPTWWDQYGNYVLIGGGALAFIILVALLRKRESGKALTVSYPPPSGRAKMRDTDVMVALMELYVLAPESEKAKDAVVAIEKKITPKTMLGAGKETRQLLNERGFIEGYPYWEARHINRLAPEDPKWNDAVIWWYENWYKKGAKKISPFFI